MKKVKYVASDSTMLAYPISTGQSEFLANVEYEVNDADFNRLMLGGDFEEVVPKEKKTVALQPVRIKDEDKKTDEKDGEDN